MLVLDVVIRIRANRVINPIPIQDHDLILDPAIILLHSDPIINYSIPSNNSSSFSSIQPPPEPHPNNSTHTASPDNSTYTLSQHIIDELKAQIKEIATTLKSLDETVSWMQDTITHHDYRISELETMMNYDNNNPGDSDLYPPHNDQDNHSYDNG
ncbi:hypothetical protein RIR_jg12301.t1 [Rhizophagus irregularis DAOM 181602=DAOM 197198]|nr:hypothetical protein RIR_jg12301.t1 [Rhizophagus irregularis DAOM 181602=DAOM 197198]